MRMRRGSNVALYVVILATLAALGSCAAIDETVTTDSEADYVISLINGGDYVDTLTIRFGLGLTRNKFLELIGSFTYVQYQLNIEDATYAELPDLEGFGNFTYINELNIDSSDLASVEGLNSSFVYDLGIFDCNQLRNLSGLGPGNGVIGFNFYGNANLETFEGYVPGDYTDWGRVFIIACPKLQDISALEGMTGSVNGIVIDNLPVASVDFIDGIVNNYDVFISNLALVTEIPPIKFNEYSQSGVTVRIVFMDALESLVVDCHNTSHIENLWVNGNGVLQTFNVSNLRVRDNNPHTFVYTNCPANLIFTNVVYYTPPSFIGVVDTGIVSFDGIDASQCTGRMVAGLYLDSNPRLTSIAGLAGIDGQNETLSHYYSLQIYSAYFPPRAVTGINILNNTALTSLDGLESFTTLYGPLHVADNTALTDASALRNLVSVHDQLNSYGGSAVYTSYGWPLVWRGNINITNNENLAVVNLESLRTVHDVTMVNNNALTTVVVHTNLTSNSFSVAGSPGYSGPVTVDPAVTTPTSSVSPTTSGSSTSSPATITATATTATTATTTTSVSVSVSSTSHTSSPSIPPMSTSSATTRVPGETTESAAAEVQGGGFLTTTTGVVAVSSVAVLIVLVVIAVCLVCMMRKRKNKVSTETAHMMAARASKRATRRERRRHNRSEEDGDYSYSAGSGSQERVELAG